MPHKKSYIKINKEWWDKMADNGCGFTEPWLDLDKKIVLKVAQGKLKKIPNPLNDIYPINILSNLKGKSVLCLAASGGQQSAIFGLLGANITVVDISGGQLMGDEEAARHYGYKVETIQTSMTNLSMLKNNSFDLVYQAPSMTYVKEIHKVYREVARVLKKGGIYRADGQNPIAFSVDDQSWNRKGYSIVEPYSVKEHQRSKDEKVIEFRHYLSNTFNGLIKSGFNIEEVVEMPTDLYQSAKVKPNTWEHSLLYVPCSFAIVAKKK